jgi:hypothetical protein
VVQELAWSAPADAFDDSERAMVRAAVTPLLAPLLPCGFIMALAGHRQGNELAAIRYFEHSRSAAASRPDTSPVMPRRGYPRP